MQRKSVSHKYRCNGALIAKLRARLGWTQEVLASKSGFSDRLIRKAESGGQLSTETVKILARTFEENGVPVKEADLLTDPTDLARQFIQYMYTEKSAVIDLLDAYIDDQVVFQFAGDPAVFPFSGRHVGKAAARVAFDQFYSVIQPPEDMAELDAFEFLHTGVGALVWGKTWAHPIGMPMKEPVALAIRMDFQHGKLVLFDDCFDTTMGLEHFKRANEIDR